MPQNISEKILSLLNCKIFCLGDLMLDNYVIGNTNRIIAKNQNLNIDWNSWEWPPIFKLIQESGSVPTDEKELVILCFHTLFPSSDPFLGVSFCP